MSTINEIQQELRKVKKESRSKDKIIEELKIREKLYLERLENAHNKNHELRHDKLNMTIDDVVAMQKARAEFEKKHFKDQEVVNALEKQQEVKIDGVL